MNPYTFANTTPCAPEMSCKRRAVTTPDLAGEDDSNDFAISELDKATQTIIPADAEANRRIAMELSWVAYLPYTEAVNPTTKALNFFANNNPVGVTDLVGYKVIDYYEFKKSGSGGPPSNFAYLVEAPSKDLFVVVRGTDPSLKIIGLLEQVISEDLALKPTATNPNWKTPSGGAPPNGMLIASGTKTGVEDLLQIKGGLDPSQTLITRIKACISAAATAPKIACVGHSLGGTLTFALPPEIQADTAATPAIDASHSQVYWMNFAGATPGNIALATFLAEFELNPGFSRGWNVFDLVPRLWDDSLMSNHHQYLYKQYFKYPSMTVYPGGADSFGLIPKFISVTKKNTTGYTHPGENDPAIYPFESIPPPTTGLFGKPAAWTKCVESQHSHYGYLVAFGGVVPSGYPKA